jgi:hypothetical protein
MTPPGHEPARLSAAVGRTAWARRAGTHPQVVAALAAEQVSESVGRVLDALGAPAGDEDDRTRTSGITMPHRR